MDSIKIEDLNYLESDLSRDELISIVFLLFGSINKLDYALESLLSSQKSAAYLKIFATKTSNWRPMLIEALATANVFECIKNLGVSMEVAREMARTKPTLNHSIKLLYQLCEACPQNLTQKLIAYLKGDFQTNENQLEIYLMHCIVHKIIRIDTCDFSVLIKFFLNNDKSEEIEEIIQKFPEKINHDLSTSENNVLGVYETKKMLVLIINQKTFYRDPVLTELLPRDPLHERQGTEKDSTALTKLFEDFNYEVIVKDNLTHLQILQEVKTAAKKSSTYDGLIVSLLSHGYEGLAYGSNSVPVFIKDIKDNMASRGLLNKPKILLIQACQGSACQQPVTKAINQQLQFDSPSQSINFESGSTRADSLLFWSTIEGFASVRHPENGSWFIQEFVKKVNELYSEQHLVDICTAVTNEVSAKRGYRNECVIPKLETTFLRFFRFPNKIR